MAHRKCILVADVVDGVKTVRTVLGPVPTAYGLTALAAQVHVHGFCLIRVDYSTFRHCSRDSTAELVWRNPWIDRAASFIYKFLKRSMAMGFASKPLARRIDDPYFKFALK